MVLFAFRIKYCDWLEGHKMVEELKQVYNRAVRNLPWSSTLWSGMIRIHEYETSPFDFEKVRFQKFS